MIPSQQHETAHKKKLTGRHMLAMLGGFFGIMLLANLVFVYFALTSFTGVSVENSYNKGLNYNRELQAKSRQDALGWKVRLDIVSPADLETRVTLNLLDKNGVPIPDLEVSAHIRNPVDDEGDIAFDLKPGDNDYSARVILPRAGQWDLQIQASHPSLQAPYRINRRFMAGS